MRLPLCCAAVVVALVIAGCGSDSGSSTSASSQPTATTAQQQVLHYITREAKPKNPGPHPGARVDRLIVKEVRKGQGPAIQAGDTGIFEFISTDWVTGKPLDESWHRRRPFESQVERNVVIDGWWQGIPGMRVGGRRQLIIPPSLGFTQSTELREITSYFDIVLVEIRPQQPPGVGGGSGGESTQAEASVG